MRHAAPRRWLSPRALLQVGRLRVLQCNAAHVGGGSLRAPFSKAAGSAYDAGDVMDCIKCEGKLKLIRIDDLEVDQCDRCHGIWFDSGELSKMVGRKDVDALRTGARPTKEADEKRAGCPRCRGAGKLVQVASMTNDIHIDACAVCGGEWLDGGELSIVRNEGFSRTVAAFFRKILEM